MKKTLSQKLTYWLGVVSLGLILGISLQFVQAWTEPTAAPPGGSLGGSINTGLVGYWKFDEGSGSIAGDASGNGNNGNLINSPTRVTGKVNGALSFDGVDDYVDAGNLSSLKYSTALTVCSWVKTSSNVSSGITRQFSSDTNERYWLLNKDANGVISFWVTAQYMYWDAHITGTTAVNNGTWQHICAVYNGTNDLKLYINGVSEGSITGTEPAHLYSGGLAATVPIGSDGVGNYFNGSLDEVSIYNRALSADEIQSLFGGSLPAVAPFCGDNVCNGIETCSSCPFDCGTCPADLTAPSTPANLSALAISSSQVNLSWSASTDNIGVAGYKIYRNGVQIATSQPVSYQDTGLSASTAYSYAVSAYDAAGNESAQSTSASATTQASLALGVAVSDLTLIALTNEATVILYWQDPANLKAEGYKIGYSATPITADNWDLVSKFSKPKQSEVSTGPFYRATNLNLNTTYYFAVKAFDASGNYTDLSSVVSVKTTDSLKSWNVLDFNSMAGNSWEDLNPAMPPGNTSQIFLSYDQLRDTLMTWGGHLYGGGFPQVDDLYTYNIGNLSKENTWKLEDINLSSTSDKPNGGCMTSGEYDDVNKMMIKYTDSTRNKYEYYRGQNLEVYPWLYDFDQHKWYDMKVFNFQNTVGWAANAPGHLYNPDDQYHIFVDSAPQVFSRTNFFDVYNNKLYRMQNFDGTQLGGTRTDPGLVYDSKRKKFVIVGGSQQRSPAYNDVWEFNFVQKKWVKVEGVKNSEIIPTFDSDATAAVYDSLHDKIILFDYIGRDSYYTDARVILTFIYDPETKTWSRGNDKPGQVSAKRLQDLNAVFSEKYNVALVLDSGDTNYSDASKTWAYRYSDTIPAQTKPSAPQNAALETTTTSAILKWQASGSSGVTGYNIYRAQADNPWDATYAKITAVSSSATSYTDLSITPGKIYFYYATAINASGESEASFKVRTQPRVIQEGYVAVLSDQQTKVKWTPRDEDTDVVGYNVYRAVPAYTMYPLNQPINSPFEIPQYVRPTLSSIFDDEVSYIKINSSLILGNEFTDNINLLNSGAAYPYKVYTYRVKAVNKFGVESGWSPYWATIPNPPTGLQVTKDANNQYVSWLAPQNGEGIKGYRAYVVYQEENGREEITTNILTDTSLVVPMTRNQVYYITAIDNLDQEGVPSYGAWVERPWWQKFYSQYYQFSITTSFLPDATISQSYNIGLQTVNGTAPYSWQITSGSLPAGLSLNSSTGLISGTPANIGDYTFTIKVTDSSNPAKEATKKFTFKVNNILTKTYGNSDFANLVTDWLLTKSSSADASGDGTVNSKDLGIMMSHWAN